VFSGVARGLDEDGEPGANGSPVSVHCPQQAGGVMDKLLTALTRIERDLRDRREAVVSLSDYIDAMQSMGIKVTDETLTVEMLKGEISTLSVRQSMLTRVLRRTHTRPR
jgi:hypothetical protein